MGIARNRAVTYENDHDGIALNYEAVGRAVKGITKSRNCSIELDDAWAEDIAEYHEKAGKGRQSIIVIYKGDGNKLETRYFQWII